MSDVSIKDLEADELAQRLTHMGRILTKSPVPKGRNKALCMDGVEILRSMSVLFTPEAYAKQDETIHDIFRLCFKNAFGLWFEKPEEIAEHYLIVFKCFEKMRKANLRNREEAINFIFSFAKYLEEDAPDKEVQ